MAADLSKLITKLGLGDHRDFLFGIARPSIEMVTVTTRIARGCSKFGGSPDLPISFEWPLHQYGPYRFLGQVNLGDIPTGSYGLPGRGLLSFFFVHDEDGKSIFWHKPHYVRVYHFSERDTLRSVKPPAAVRLGSTLRFELQPGMDVPPKPWFNDPRTAGWPIGESQNDAYWKLR